MLSLLISAEGHLTPLFHIEDAEKNLFDQPPDCFVNTSYGTPLGHVAIVHLLDAIRLKYCTNLKVSDGGQYYETRDIYVLEQRMQLLNTATRSNAEGLREHGLNKEAPEDPNILAARIELMKRDGAMDKL